MGFSSGISLRAGLTQGMRKTQRLGPSACLSFPTLVVSVRKTGGAQACEYPIQPGSTS